MGSRVSDGPEITKKGKNMSKLLSQVLSEDKERERKAVKGEIAELVKEFRKADAVRDGIAEKISLKLAEINEEQENLLEALK